MKIILRKDVPKIGRKHEVKDVADGYAVNFLIPRGLAWQATEGRLRALKRARAREQERQSIQAELLQRDFAKLEGATIVCPARANVQGHLFKSVHKEEVVAAIADQLNVHVPASAVVLERPIKEVGLYSLEVRVGEKRASFKCAVHAAKEG